MTQTWSVSLKLAELVDLECQIIKDTEMDPSELRRRDRKIGQELEKRNLDRHALFLTWLKLVQTVSMPTSGQLFEIGCRWLGYVLLLCGFLSGISTATSVFAYDGTRPVNIINFLAVIVGFQVLTILFFLLNLLPRPIKRIVPGIGNFYNFIRDLGYLFSRLTGKISKRLPVNEYSQVWTTLKQLKIRHKLYEAIEKWLVVTLTQRFSLAFNLGTLVTCLYLIVFSDLAFAWNTTLHINTHSFHTVVRIIATPWASVIPAGVPSPELVRVSRYSRLEDEYIHKPAELTMPEAMIVGDWWLFLSLCLVCYGLVPRLVIFIVAKVQLSQSLVKLPLKSADFEALYDRLTRPLVETRAIEPEAEPGRMEQALLAKVDFAITEKRCTVVRWGDLELRGADLTRLLETRFGWQLRHEFEAGGLDYEATNVPACNAIGQQQGKEPVLVLVESWEAPDSAILYFLEQLRKSMAIDRPIIVGLVHTESSTELKPPARDDWHTWSLKLASLVDPYLRVEAMVEVA